MTDNAPKLTHHARHVLISARERARDMGQNQIAPEHILLGILAEESSSAANLLKDLNVELPQLRQRIEENLKDKQYYEQGEPDLTEDTQIAMTLAAREARDLGFDYLGSEHLLLGVLQEGHSLAADVLSHWNLNVHTIRAQLETYDLPKERAVKPLVADMSPGTATEHRSFLPSPVFVALVLIAGLTGYLMYQRTIFPQVMLFLFVTSGWVVSLCLHEFGHALVAWWGGDKQVADRGYLTLNPLKYTHGLYSIVLPLVFLAMGGIGLPGGAVYIRRRSIGKRFMRSVVSAAGPLMSALCALFLSLPFMVGLDESYGIHAEFWAGLGLLANLQITAFLFNLLPFPGLDGFGLLMPYLPRKLSREIRRLGSWSLVILFLLFFVETPVARVFWRAVWSIESLLGIDGSWISSGLDLFMFWTL